MKQNHIRQNTSIDNYNSNSSDESTNSNTIACFLDLPSGSALNVDGISLSIQRDDFVGISQIPVLAQEFHFITIAAKSSSLTTGFVLLHGENVLVRRYDPRTEEVSSTLRVDATTIDNLLQQTPALEHQQRIVPYPLFVNSEQQTKWNRHLTNYISKDLLQQRGIRTSGQKIVPGCLEDNDSNTKETSQQEPDGTPLSYPPVPILDQRRPRWASHVGTQRFLQTLSAEEKTNLFVVVDSQPSQRAWERLFAKQYSNNWAMVLGDVQLSFLFFVHLHCFESLVHWRDLLSLLGQLENPSRLLVPVLMHQLSNLDASDVLPTDENDDQEGNSIATALERLLQTWRQQGPCDDDGEDSLQRLSDLIQDRLCPRIQSVGEDEDEENEEVDDEEDEADHDLNDDDDDSEGPMVVAMDDYQAALQRNQETNRVVMSHSVHYTPEISQNYPILWAAKQEHEDLVMTCARALEEANDVSLVRQAANYLQQVEANSKPLFTP